MSKEIIKVDKDCLIKLAKNQDDLKHRLDHLESHIHKEEPEVPPTGFFFTASCQNSVPPQKQKAYVNQLRAERESVFKEYGCIGFEGVFTK